MFDFVAKHKRWIQLLLGLVAVSFTLWGVENYQRMGSAGGEVATVSGEKITRQEVSDLMRQQQDRLRQMLGNNFDPAMLESPGMRAELLEGLINQRLLTQYAVGSHMLASDDLLREIISAQPAFQENGRFSRAVYERLLQAQNMTPTSFENSLRRDLLTSQVAAAMAESSLASSAVAKEFARLRLQQREVSELLLPLERFAAQIKPDDAAIAAFYEANAARFKLPEQVQVEFVELSLQNISTQEVISAEDVKAFYDANYGSKFKERSEARAKAEALLAELRRSPDRFAELAKQNSQDPGSKDSGGDLGFFARGSMVKPFEDTVFRLRENEISTLVETDFGFHIIRLTGINSAAKSPSKTEERRASHILITAPAAAKSIEALRPEIEKELRRQRAGKRFAEAAESFSNLAYEQPDSLKPVAEKFKIAVQNAGWVTRQASPNKSINHPKVLAALFAADAIANRRNIEVIETAPGVLVSARVLAHKPEAARPLSEVRADVLKLLIDREAREAARKQGEQQLAALRKGDATATIFPAAKLVSRDKADGITVEALQALYRADVSTLPAYIGVESAKGYVLLRVSKLVEQEPPEKLVEAARAEVARSNGAREYQAFITGLRNRAKVEIDKAQLEAKTP